MLEGMLTKEECAECRLCCRFEGYDLLNTPMIHRELASRIIQEYLPTLELIRWEHLFLMKMQRDEEDGMYPCPLCGSNGCIMGDDKPFECMLFPFRIMQRADGEVVLALSPACPLVMNKPQEVIKAAALASVPAALEAAALHPELIKPYTADHRIYTVLTDKSPNGRGG